jgi:hypothetical protein
LNTLLDGGSHLLGALALTLDESGTVAPRRRDRDHGRLVGPPVHFRHRSGGRRCAAPAWLSAWLRHQGEVRLVAVELHVHAQTVRYRVGRLRDLLGVRLTSPDGRLELELALRARRLRAAREG